MALDLVASPRSFGTRFVELEECLDSYLTWYTENESRVVDFYTAVNFLSLALNSTVYLFHLMRDRVTRLRGKFANVTDLDKALDSYTHEYAATVDTIVDPVKKVEFFKEALDNNLRLFHMLYAELRNAERKQVKDTLIHLPTQYR